MQRAYPQNESVAWVVIKHLDGAQGIGEVLASTKRSTKSLVETFRGASISILLQKLIKEAGGTDIRAIVVDKRAVTSKKNTGAESEFRSNRHRGGSAELIKLSLEACSTAAGAAKSMGLNVCGVDMLRSNRWIGGEGGQLLIRA